MVKDFSKNLIKEYRYWNLFLAENQYPYLGRCVAWAKRKDADLVTEMTKSESVELFQMIIPQWDRAVKKLYDYSRPNVAILGNASPHLHAHLIPRYNAPVKFYGIKFTDPNPKGNYAPYPKKKIDSKTMENIKKDMISEIY